MKNLKERELGRIEAQKVVFEKPYYDEKGNLTFKAKYEGQTYLMGIELDLGTLKEKFCCFEYKNPEKSNAWIIGFRNEVANIANSLYKVE